MSLVLWAALASGGSGPWDDDGPVARRLEEILAPEIDLTVAAPEPEGAVTCEDFE